MVRNLLPWTLQYDWYGTDGIVDFGLVDKWSGDVPEHGGGLAGRQVLLSREWRGRQF